jgi:hypothetical protein
VKCGNLSNMPQRNLRESKATSSLGSIVVVNRWEEKAGLRRDVRPGVTLAQAQAECLVIWRNAMEEYWKLRDPAYMAHDLHLGMDLEPTRHDFIMSSLQFLAIVCKSEQFL